MPTPHEISMAFFILTALLLVVAERYRVPLRARRIAAVLAFPSIFAVDYDLLMDVPRSRTAHRSRTRGGSGRQRGGR